MSTPLRVIIAEDEWLTAASLKIDFEKLGAEVIRLVSRGEDAVKYAMQEGPDLILMDIRLTGGIDGITAAETILQNQKTSIVFMSGYSGDRHHERIQNVNPFDFMEKPVTITQIRQLVEKLIKD